MINSPKPSDSDYVRRIMRENEAGQMKRGKAYTVKLPCNHFTLEVEKAGDQWLVCPKCFKRFLLTWNPIESNRKIAEQVPDLVRRYF